MAATKVWEWGEMSLRPLSERLDYGMATANTRLGALGGWFGASGAGLAGWRAGRWDTHDRGPHCLP
jgi:hypothetical protein